jgi:hypothetical protein
MSAPEVLPLLIPICGAIFAFSVSGYCCLRRKMRGEYNSLEYRVRCLEQQISSKSLEPIIQQSYTPVAQTYNQYSSYSQAVVPSAPQSMSYATPPSNPYITTYSI